MLDNKNVNLLRDGNIFFNANGGILLHDVIAVNVHHNNSDKNVNLLRDGYSTSITFPKGMKF